ncbi:MAG: 7-cyano-7-deazaguanine synthase QueC [Desulfobacterales bacterium]|nr:7-cyano-7-deazaguanine synthase QueC [Desulfobacterales bacterium]
MTPDISPDKAIILLSGGLDSTTVLAIARAQGFACYCLSFDYGQRQVMELEQARANADRLGALEHLVLRIDLGRIGGSALTTEVSVPKGRDFGEMEKSVPVTYVPGRNTIFLSYAMAWAEVKGAGDIFIGVNALDYSGYPDCRPEYLRAFERLAGLATRAGAEEHKKLKIQAPLLQLSKREIIEKGVALGVDYRGTHSCYDPLQVQGEVLACGECDSCRLRLKGFAEAGLVDPLPYRGKETP